MTDVALWIEEAPDEIGLHDLVWRSDGESSLRANVSPSLARLGEVSPYNRDAFWLAVAVFLVDRTVARREGWERDLGLSVPVSDVGAWNGVVDDVERAISFLTSDSWRVEFRAVPEFESEAAAPRSGGDLVCLFSGGADSLCGAVRALNDGRTPLLVSHWDWTGHSEVQRRMAGQLSALFDVDVPHLQVRLGRRGEQLDGTSFRDEPSRRSRSLLFICLGLAIASAVPSLPVWIPENGFASLNPPLASERRGSLSTRTTHPTFFGHTRSFLEGVGAHAAFSNPFSTDTKGEIFQEIEGILGYDTASRLISETHSCTHVRRAMSFGYGGATHCGVCFGCAVRRGAFLQAGLNDRTTYLVDELTDSQRERFLSFGSVGSEVETLRYATERELTEADVLALNLPSASDLDVALSLIRRGFEELSSVELP